MNATKLKEKKVELTLRLEGYRRACANYITEINATKAKIADIDAELKRLEEK